MEIYSNTLFSDVFPTAIIIAISPYLWITHVVSCWSYGFIILWGVVVKTALGRTSKASEKCWAHGNHTSFLSLFFISLRCFHELFLFSLAFARTFYTSRLLGFSALYIGYYTTFPQPFGFMQLLSNILQAPWGSLQQKLHSQFKGLPH